MFDHALRSPSDGWLWRLSACAGGGTLTNIRPDGSASMGLHGDPDLLTRDAYSADFGIGFYGHWKNAGAYLSCSSALGWLCVGCDILGAASTATEHACEGEGAPRALTVVPRDAFGRRLYLMPLGSLLTVDGASISSAEIEIGPSSRRRSAALLLRPVPAGSTHAIVTLTADGEHAPFGARLRCDAPCSFSPLPFGGRRDVGGSAHNVRLVAAGETTLHIEVDAPASG